MEYKESKHTIINFGGSGAEIYEDGDGFRIMIIHLPPFIDNWGKVEITYLQDKKKKPNHPKKGK